MPSHPKSRLQKGHSPRKHSPRLIHGRLNVHRDGYGFVIPDEPVPGVKGDIYLDKAEAERAMHGDQIGRAHV